MIPAEEINKRGKEALPLGCGAENDGIVISLASENAGTIVESIAISPWTSSLKNGRVKGGLACGWVGKLPAAAVLVQPKGLTCTLTCNHPSLSTITTDHLKFLGATY